MIEFTFTHYTLVDMLMAEYKEAWDYALEVVKEKFDFDKLEYVPNVVEAVSNFLIMKKFFVPISFVVADALVWAIVNKYRV